MTYVLELLAGWFAADAGERLARSAWPWALGSGLIGAMLIAAVLLRLFA
jgi:hypothetical protein